MKSILLPLTFLLSAPVFAKCTDPFVLETRWIALQQPFPVTYEICHEIGTLNYQIVRNNETINFPRGKKQSSEATEEGWSYETPLKNGETLDLFIYKGYLLAELTYYSANDGRLSSQEELLRDNCPDNSKLQSSWIVSSPLPYGTKPNIFQVCKDNATEKYVIQKDAKAFSERPLTGKQTQGHRELNAISVNSEVYSLVLPLGNEDKAKIDFFTNGKLKKSLELTKVE